MTASTQARIAGLLAAAVVAWALSLVFDLAPAALEAMAAGPASTVPGPAQFRSFFILYAVVGLPVAWLFVLLAGLPGWALWERRGRTGRADAIRLGALVGLLLGLALAALALASGLRASSYDAWSYGYQTIADGMPTALGWFFRLLDIGLTVLTGAAAGLTAWTVAAFFEARRGAV